METVKLRRGPRPGYREVQQYSDRILFSRPKPDRFKTLIEDPMAEIFEYGHYQRTNIVTRKGVAVFEWMGWKGEVLGD